MELRNMTLGQALKFLNQKESVFIDLRSREEYALGHLKGAVNIPYEELEKEKKKLRKYQQIFLYCERGNVSLMAARDLKKEGFPVINIWGGVREMKKKYAGVADTIDGKAEKH